MYNPTDKYMPLSHVKERLSQWRGCLVNMPLHFLEEEDVSFGLRRCMGIVLKRTLSQMDKGTRGMEVNDMTLAICECFFVCSFCKAKLLTPCMEQTFEL